MRLGADFLWKCVDLKEVNFGCGPKFATSFGTIFRPSLQLFLCILDISDCRKIAMLVPRELVLGILSLTVFMFILPVL